MPRIRTVKPEFWQDEKLAPLSPIDRLVFLGLLSIADDAGRLLDNIKHIDGFLFPETEESSRDSIETLARLSRIIRYTSPSGQKLIQIARWENHQKVDNPAKKVLPAPTAEQVAAAKDSASVASVSRKPREDHARLSRSDLGPRTMDLGPSTSPAPRSGAEKHTWMSDYQADFEAAYGEGSKLPVKPNVRDASELEKAHGRAEVRLRWQRLLARKEADYVSFALLKKMWGQLGENGSSRAPPKKPTAAEQSIINSRIAFGHEPHD